MLNLLLIYLRRDRCRTTTNVLDDCYATAVIAKLTEHELDNGDLKATKSESEKMLQQTNENIV